jgi:hypothetical protein
VGAPAADVETGIGDATRMLKEGRILEAYKSLKRSIDALAPMVHLTVLRSALVKDDPGGTGLYQPRPSNRFAPGERILIYGDVVGFSTRVEEGRNKLSLTFDYVLTGPDGEILAGKRGFGAWEQESLNPITETYFYLAYDFTGLTSGIYDIETVVRDAVSGEETSLVVPIEIVAAPVGEGATGKGREK